MEKFRIGRVTAHKRTEGSNWSLYWRIGGKRYRRTTQALMRHTAEEIATELWILLRRILRFGSNP